MRLPLCQTLCWNSLPDYLHHWHWSLQTLCQKQIFQESISLLTSHFVISSGRCINGTLQMILLCFVVLCYAVLCYTVLFTAFDRYWIIPNYTCNLTCAWQITGIVWMLSHSIIFLSSCMIMFQNLLDNFKSADIMAFVARIFLFFQMTTVFPLLTFIFRIQTFYAVFGTVDPGSVSSQIVV